MAFNVAEFRSNMISDGARPNLFEVTLTIPTLVDNAIAASQKSVFMCKTAQLPGSTIGQVLIRNIVPADSVVASANELVRAKNELKQKEVEVKTAKMEAERMQALSNQGAQSIAYMQAQAMMNISEGIKNGRVQTIVVPANFNALMMQK